MDNDVVLVGTTMMGALDCWPGEHQLNNGAECYFDSALCNNSVSIVPNN